MQPKNLIMQNFGPFIYETVDFEDFQEAGLFLISGKTGAGKTTIFDGMTFALFGETSGQLRSGKEMRSMFATPEEETLVTFTFEHQGLLYEIARSPEQELTKKRGEGTRKQTAKVALTIYNLQRIEQKQYTKRTEVDQFIKDLLHVDAKQFFQIILLPQGEFRNFLIASSNEKEKLLRHLFGTELYQRLNDWLRLQQKELAEALSQQRHQAEALVGRFQWNEVAKPVITLAETLQDWQGELAVLQEKQQMTKQELARAKKQEKLAEEAWYAGKELSKQCQEYRQLQEKQQELTEELPNIQVAQGRFERLTWVEKQANLLANLEQSRDNQQIAEQELARIIEQMQQTEQNQKSWQAQATLIEEQKVQLADFQKNRQRIEDLLPYAETVQSLQAELTENHQSLKEQAELITNLNQTLQTIELEEANCQEHLAMKEGWQQAEIRLIRGEQLVSQWQMAQEAVEKTQELIETQQAMSQTLTQKLGLAREQHSSLDEAFKECQSENAKMQIARLRLLLKPGEPCPICGSTEHQQANIHETYTSEEIMQSESALKEAETALQQQAATVQQYVANQLLIEQQLKELEEQRVIKQQTLDEYTKQCAEFFDSDLSVQTPIEVLAQRKSDHEDEKKQLEKVQQRMKELVVQKENVQEHQAALQKEQQVKQEICQTLTTKIATLQEQLQQRSYSELQAELSALTTNVQQLSTTITAYHEQGATLQLAAATLANDSKHWTQQLERLHEKRTNEQEQLAQIIAASPYEVTEDSLRVELADTKELTKLQQILDDYQQANRFVSQRLAELADIAQQAMPDLQQLQLAYEQAEQQTGIWQQQLIQQQEIERLNQGLLQELTQLTNENHVQLEEMSQLQQLSETMNGDNPQKMSLERYVLQSFLAEILEVANQRLLKLTRGRYQFLLAEEKGSYRSSTGLEINIYDDNAGMSRRAHTLSGGESFIAALALALSLADVIQNRAGGIAIEALFIDEGFGSLDEESLEMAMESLEMIENEGRLIGIISHVRELKDRIQQQLIVQTDGNGRSHIKSQLV